MGGPFVSRGAWPGGLRADCLGSTHHSMPPNSNRRRDDEPEIFFLQYEEIVGQKGTEGEGQENYLQAHERERVALKSSKQHCRSCISFVSAGRQTDCFIASGWRPYDMFNIRFSSLKEIRRHLIQPTDQPYLRFFPIPSYQTSKSIGSLDLLLAFIHHTNASS